LARARWANEDRSTISLHARASVAFIVSFFIVRALLEMKEIYNLLSPPGQVHYMYPIKRSLAWNEECWNETILVSIDRKREFAGDVAT
jgi:hypothetical protein